MRIHAFLFLILFNVINFQIITKGIIDLDEGKDKDKVVDIKYYLDSMTNNGLIYKYYEIKQYFGNNVAIGACSLDYPEDICERIIMIYLPNPTPTSNPSDDDDEEEEEEKPPNLGKLIQEKNCHILDSILSKSEDKIEESNSLKKNANKIKKAFPKIFGKK